MPPEKVKLNRDQRLWIAEVIKSYRQEQIPSEGQILLNLRKKIQKEFNPRDFDRRLVDDGSINLYGIYCFKSNDQIIKDVDKIIKQIKRCLIENSVPRTITSLELESALDIPIRKLHFYLKLIGQTNYYNDGAHFSEDKIGFDAFEIRTHDTIRRYLSYKSIASLMDIFKKRNMSTLMPTRDSEQKKMGPKKNHELKSAFSVYQLGNKIGEGGAGLVFSAMNESGDKFAIKILNLDKATKEKVKRFHNEYAFCSRNTHKGIIKVIDNGLTENDEPFFVMPLFDSSLRTIVQKIQPKDVENIISQILDGVEAAHLGGVVHRDLKPENILLRGLGETVVITDFGIAHFEADELLTAVETKDAARLANFQYAAPEQRMRGQTIDNRADIYALGLIINELFTKKLAHGTGYKTIGVVAPEYSYLDDIIAKMLSQEPEHRYSTIDEVKKDILLRGKEYISRQRISQIDSTVIPSSEIDDPLISKPPTIIDVDWNNNKLIIVLSQPVHQKWLNAFHSMDGNVSYLIGKGPGNFAFSGNTASIGANANQVQQIVDMFKSWLVNTTRTYQRLRQEEMANNERKEKEALRLKRILEEERRGVLAKIKF